MSKKLILCSVLGLALTGCASSAFDAENENSARNRGAAGGALVGATLGALTGEADLAVKGAVAGGVAGGVAGSMKDLDDARAADRNQTLADGVAGDNRSETEKRVAELEAQIKLLELEKQLAELEAEQLVDIDEEDELPAS
ncbi:hypothetical protein JCM19232_3135 [Vibrio ishigakensis]|uniref:Glycine zipper domain-containing protein n=2 Tax=Vibrio ishigakensis TaxID=1481914 RepID=A0A0B8NZ83_9VIBR|nr:glycine zipper domain-containing protein [Vibrio ishigakensis]GAM56044.1 hypothetical protein JCM19231_5681 [Vibrio ishigakensis]GAM64842.1 hypothetical protein JCM19232_3135 [Vibrio ishigakensis]